MDIVLISDDLPDYQQLVEAAEPGTKVIVYDADVESPEEVVEKVTELSKETGRPLGSVTLLSHGEDGSFYLGNQEISAANVDGVDSLAELKSALSEDAHIYIYGCNVVDDSGDGALLIERVSEITGAKVFASDDNTGKDGDWELEAETGDEREAVSPPLDMEKLADYDFNLKDNFHFEMISYEDMPFGGPLYVWGAGVNATSHSGGDITLVDPNNPTFPLENYDIQYIGWTTDQPIQLE